MALQKTTVTIPLGLGVNTKTDEKLVEQGQFNLVCENATFDKVGAVKKRMGLDSMSDTYYNPEQTSGNSGSISTLTYKPTMASALGSSPFLRCSNGDYLYYHNEAYIYRNSYPIPECKVSSVPLYSASYSVKETDSQYDSYQDIIITAIRDSLDSTSGKAALAIYDRTTGSVVLNSTGGTTTSGSYYFGYVRTGMTRSGGHSYYYLAYTTPDRVFHLFTFNAFGQQVGSELTVSNIPAAYTTTQDNGPIAVCSNGDDSKIFFILPTTTSGTGHFLSITGTTVNVNATFNHGILTGGGFNSSSARYGGSQIRFAFMSGSSTVYEMSLSESGTISSAATSIFSVTSGLTISYAKNSNDIYYSEGALGSTATKKWNGSTSSIESYNSCILTETFAGSHGMNLSALAPYFDGVSFNTAYFLCPTGTASAQKTVARVATGLARTLTGNASRVARISDSINSFALPVFAGNNGQSDAYNANLYIFETSQNYESNSRSIIGKNLHVSGGFMSEFDGERLFENGFHLRCPKPTLTQTGTGLTGTFSYICVLKYVDKNGQVTRSAPSDAVSTGAITNKAIQITLPAMPFGVKVTNCSVEIYRTQNAGSTYYLVQTVVADTMDSGNSAWSSTVTDSASDSSVSDNTILYTSGNILQNDPAPACKGVIQGGNRLFLVGLEDENEIAYSKEKLFGESVNFSDFFRIRIDTAQFNTVGGVVAGGYMDDKLILGKESSLFYVTGQGPNETGGGNTFTEPELISSETGITDPRSVVLTPRGLMFKGRKGIYLLDRGMGTSYVGAPIEEYNTYEVTAAVHIDKKNQVVFSLKKPQLDEGVLAVFDYYTEQWSIVPSVYATDLDVVDGDLLVLNGSTSIPQIQDGSDFTDNSSVYSMKVKTPWIKVSGVQDFSRIWSCTILGKYKSAHDLIVKARYDYDEDYVETYTITPQSTDKQYQYRCHLQKQKCEAIQFEIYDSNQTGESMELTALTLEVGLRKGSMKLPATRKY